MADFRLKRRPKTSPAREATNPFFKKAGIGGNHFFSSAAENSLQPKLSIGKPGGKLEQEADSMADAVVNQQHTPQIQQQPEDGFLHRQPAEEEEEEVQPKLDIQRIEAPEDEELQTKPDIQKMETPKEEEGVQPKLEIQRMGAPEEEEVQPKAESGAPAASNSLSTQLQQAKGRGNPLPSQTQVDMSNAFGQDFSDVNIHTDKDAIQMNQALKAQAFTHGKDIYFNQGKYDTASSSGKHLLAHELTHVVQQNKD